MKKIIFAVPKGRILDDLLPLMKEIGIVPEKEFFNTSSRKLIFKTSLPNFEIQLNHLYTSNNAAKCALNRENRR